MRKEVRFGYFKNTFLPCVASGLAVGAIVGTAVFFFKAAADKLVEYSSSIYAYVRANPAFLPLLFAGLALLAAAQFFLQKYAPETRGGGIPRSVGVIRGILTFRWLRTAVGAVINSFLSFFAGLPLGTEGSSVLLGCSLGAGASVLPLARRNFSKYMMTGGASAGFAVATGAPLSGIIFAVEETHKRVTPTMMLAVLSAVISSGLVSRLLSAAMGVTASPLFAFPDGQERTFALAEIWIVLLAGIAVGLFSAAFCRLTEVFARYFDKKCSKRRRLIRFVLLFWLVGTAGFFINDALYGGHDLVDGLLGSSAGAGHTAAVLAIRIALIALCSGIGASGGLFIPMLSLGALTGSLVAKACTAMGADPLLSSYIVLVCTVSFMGASTKAPITALAFAMECTWRFSNLFYAAVAVFLAYFVTAVTRTKSAYEFMLERMAKRQAEGKTYVYKDVTIAVEAGSFAEGKTVSDLLLSSNIVARKNLPCEDAGEAVLGGERTLKAGDVLVFTAYTCDVSSVEEELENYFAKQEKRKWKKRSER